LGQGFMHLPNPSGYQTLGKSVADPLFCCFLVTSQKAYSDVCVASKGPPLQAPNQRFAKA